MGNSYHLGHLFLLTVIIWMFNYRTAWSLERKGEFLACVYQDVVLALPYKPRLLRSPTATECIAECSDRAGFAALSPPLLAPYDCMCFDDIGDVTDLVRDAVPFSRCNATCRGNPLESCGGDGLFSVYKTTNRTCDDPGMPVNGSRIGDELVIGSQVVYNCSSGLVADGPTVSQCWWVDNITLDIAWTVPLPACLDPSLLGTTDIATGPDTATTQRMTTPPFQPPTSITVVIIGSLAGVIILIIVVVIVLVFMCNKRQKRRADFSRGSGQSSIPLSNSKAHLTQTTPKKKEGEKEHANDVEEEEEEDYLVPDAKVMSSAKNGSGQGHTLQLVDHRPRLPAPPSVKASLTPEESLYQNSLSIALSRSKENLRKDTSMAKEKIVSNEPAYQNRTVVTRHDRPRATEGAVVKPPATKASSLPLDADGVYQNTQVGARLSSPRMPLTARLSDDRRASRDSSGTASQRSSLNYRDSVDYVTPNEATEQEVYENAGVIRQRQGPRRPPGKPDDTNVTVDTSDTDGVYLDLI